MGESTGTLSTFGSDQDVRRALVFPALEFFSPTLVDGELEKVEVPAIEVEVLPVLRRHRLVVFGGRQVAEKALLAKHLAWYLSRTLGNEGVPCRVLQWHSHSSLVQVSDALDGQSDPTVFLFVGLQPYHLGGYDIARLLDHLAAGGHYAIFATDSELEQWGSVPGWRELGIWRDAEQLPFSSDHLVNVLLSRLQEVADRLPGDLRGKVESLDPQDALVGGLGVREVAERLGTPSRIRSFAAALSLSSELSETTVRETVGQVLDDRHAASWWFQSLNPRDQCLALGLAVFDGLLDDQVFSALELLVQDAWRHWDASLTYFDYHELGRLANYFEGTRELSRTVRIECSSPTARKALFDVGWRLYRRRMLATLPVLAEIVRDSPGESYLLARSRASATDPRTNEVEVDEADGAGADEEADLPEEELRASRWYRHGRWRDLFGSPLRNALLRNCVAGTLSQMARVSPDAVEPILLDLAQDGRHSVQSVAASALARWRELDPEDEGDARLFRLLAAWQSEAFLKEYTQHRRHRAAAVRPYSYVRATIALTVSRAALYDPPNRLREPLVRCFEMLIVDRSPIVRSRVRFDTVPALAAGHLQQLEGLLWERGAPERDLLAGIALGIASAHRLRPAEARMVFEKWHQAALAISPTDPDAERRRRRSHVLAVVALTCGLVVPERAPAGFSAQEIFGLLGSLLTGEDDQLVRSAVLQAAIRQASSDLPRMAALIQELVADLAVDERDLVVREFTGLYVAQRRELGRRSSAGKLPEPDSYEVFDGTSFPLWLRGRRPPTTLEEVLTAWLQDPWRPAAIQIALACFESFAATPLERRERELREEAERQEELRFQDVQQGSAPAHRIRLRALSLGARLAVMAAVPWSSHRRAILHAALPEYLSRLPDDGKARWIPLKEVWNRGKPRWEKLKDPGALAKLLAMPKTQEHPLLERLKESADPSGEKLSGQLARAAWIHMWRWPLGAGLVLAMLGLLAVVGG